MNNTFTLDSALQASKNNKLHEWTVNYLENEGNNKKLAQHLNDINYLYLFMTEYPLDKLKRAMGPEENMPFRESEQEWEDRVSAFRTNIKKRFSGSANNCHRLLG